MKKMAVVVAVSLFAVVLVGCPNGNLGSGNLPTPEVGTNQPPTVVDKEKGDLVVLVDLSPQSANGRTKSLTNSGLIEIGTEFVNRAGFVRVSLYWAVSMPGMGKGYGTAAYNFYGPVTDGRALVQCSAVSNGEYVLSAQVCDKRGLPLFDSDNNNVTIVGGQTVTLPVEFGFLNEYPIFVKVSGIPGQVIGCGNGQIVSPDFAYQYYAGWCDHGSGLVGVNLNLPINFTDGTISLTDEDGVEFAVFDISINWLTDYSFESLVMSYSPSVNSGSLEVKPTFSFMTSILVNGKVVDYPMGLSETIRQSRSPVEVLVPNGSFDIGNVYVYGKDITITGFGPKSVLTGTFSVSSGSIKMFGLRIKNSGSGQTMPVLNFGWMDSVQMTNCVVDGDDWMVDCTGVGSFVANHCVFLSSLAKAEAEIPTVYVGSGINFFSMQGTAEVKNSILLSLSSALNWEDGAVVNFKNNCSYKCNQTFGNVDRTGVDEASFIYTDPKLVDVTDFIPMSDSPLIGKADDGADIGLSAKG